MNKKTFTATIRVDLRGLASLALCLNSHGVHKENKSKLASYGLETIFVSIAKEFPVPTTVQAVEILDTLGYGNSLKQGTLYHKALMKELASESHVSMVIEANVQKVRTLTSQALNEPQTLNEPSYLDIPKVPVIKPSQESLESMQSAGLIVSEKKSKKNLKKKPILTTTEISDENLKHNDEIKDMRDAFAVGLSSVRKSNEEENEKEN